MLLCPFHEDTRPSMVINDNMYYCFSCEEGGGVISFIMKYENCSYIGAKGILMEYINEISEKKGSIFGIL